MDIQVIDAPTKFSYYNNSPCLVVKVDGFEIDVAELCSTNDLRHSLWSATHGIIGDDGFYHFFKPEFEEAGADDFDDWFNALPEDVQAQKNAYFKDFCWESMADHLEMFDDINDLIIDRVKTLKAAKFITSIAPTDLQEVECNDDDDEYETRPNAEVMFVAELIAAFLTKEQLDWKKVGTDLDDDNLFHALDYALDIIKDETV